MSQLLTNGDPSSSFWTFAIAIVLGVIVLAVVAPSWTCLPFLLGDIVSPGELPPPLPPNCAPASEEPSPAIMQLLESRRVELGLKLLGTVTCKVPASPKSRSHSPDPQSVDSLYSGGMLQYKRHVLLAASEEVPGGTLLTVERGLMPWTRYVEQSKGSCWSQVEFWK